MSASATQKAREAVEEGDTLYVRSQVAPGHVKYERVRVLAAERGVARVRFEDDPTPKKVRYSELRYEPRDDAKLTVPAGDAPPKRESRRGGGRDLKSQLSEVVIAFTPSVVKAIAAETTSPAKPAPAAAPSSGDGLAAWLDLGGEVELSLERDLTSIADAKSSLISELAELGQRMEWIELQLPTLETRATAVRRKLELIAQLKDQLREPS